MFPTNEKSTFSAKSCSNVKKKIVFLIREKRIKAATGHELDFFLGVSDIKNKLLEEYKEN